MNEEDEIKRVFCKYCKKNKKEKMECLKFFIEIDGKVKTYGCANYKSILEKRNSFYIKYKQELHEQKVRRLKRRKENGRRKSTN